MGLTKKTNKNGFSLLEVLVYTAIFSIIVAGLAAFIIWSVNSENKARLARETLSSAQRAMRTMTYETREAKGIYTPTSNASQLSLETEKYLSLGEETSYIDFFLCDSRICFKKENQEPIALTPDIIEISNLNFDYVSSAGSPAVKIGFRAEYSNPSGRSDRQYSVDLVSAVSLRVY